MTMRWSKQVEEGLQLVYSNMSCILENGNESFLECERRIGKPNEDGICEILDPCGKCENCKNVKALEKALAWLGDQIDKHHRPHK